MKPKIHRTASGIGFGIRIEIGELTVGIMLQKHGPIKPGQVEDLIELIGKEIRQQMAPGEFLDTMLELRQGKFNDVLREGGGEGSASGARPA